MAIVKLTLPNEYGYEEAINVLARIFTKDIFSEERIVDLERCIDEIFINAIEHGYEGEEGGNVIDVIFVLDEESIIIEIQDFGKGAPLSAFEPMSETKKKRKIELGGLRVARLYANELFIESVPGEGTIVKIKMLNKKEEEKENDG